MPKITAPGNAPGITAKMKRYAKFKGVDFSTDPSQVEDYRSPSALNIISDTGGFPEKRLGWRTLLQVDGPVNGIFYLKTVEGAWRLIHGGSKIYLWNTQNDTASVLKSGVRNQRSTSFCMGEKLYILTGAEYLVYGLFENPDYDAETEGSQKYTMQLKNAEEIAYVPTTSIPQSATSQSVYQPVNLLTAKRENLFMTDGEKKVFQLDAKGLDASAVQAWVWGEEKTEGTDFTVDRTAGTLTFSSAPAAPAATGAEAGLRVRYEKTVAGYKERVTGCTICALYQNRVWLAGNPKYQNADFHSQIDVEGIDSAAYIPDTSYTEVGADSSAIMGYINTGDALAIIKEDNQQDATVFLRTTQTNAEGDYFPVKQGIAGAGAIAKGSFATLQDDPLFLTRNGVYAITTQIVTEQKTLTSRSSFVDAVLTKEENLEKAVATEWNGYYVLCLNGRAYVADSRQKSYRQNVSGLYEYEWYYWDNIPATALMELDGELFFGTADGRVCRFNSDRKVDGKIQMSAYSDDGEAIRAIWSTPFDDDGDFMVYKTLLKKGSGVYVKTYTRSGVKVFLRSDRTFETEIRRANAGIFDFSDLDFTNLTFNTLPENVVPFNTKLKKYKALQIIVKNETLNQGFGVYGVIKRFVFGGYVK